MTVKTDGGKTFRVGVGITTFNRFDRFKECFENLIKNGRDVDEILIVEDGSDKDVDKYNDYFDKLLFKHIKVRQLKVNGGVGNAKNIIMRHFKEQDYDYFFTLEDDINILSCEVFKVYIEASIHTGYQYLNFAEHGSHNNWFYRNEIKGKNYKFYPNIVGAFTLYTSKLVEELGYHDEKFKNAMEHVEYTYRASNKGFTSKFWHFIDVFENTDLLEEQEGALEDSSIRPRPDWMENLEAGLKVFKEIHGVHVGDIPK